MFPFNLVSNLMEQNGREERTWGMCWEDYGILIWWEWMQNDGLHLGEGFIPNPSQLSPLPLPPNTYLFITKTQHTFGRRMAILTHKSIKQVAVSTSFSLEEYSLYSLNILWHSISSFPALIAKKRENNIN